MTEKVVSLSGGLVLGMVFALFLGIGASQSIAPSSNFEIPSILQMTIAQASHSAEVPTSDASPRIDAAPPSNEEDRGRITRIATLTETTDPVFDPTATSIASSTASEADFKTWETTVTPKIDNLQRANLQHSYIALQTETSGTYSSINSGTARQSNFAAIAGGTTGRETGSGAEPPTLIDTKPQSHGSPAVAQNDQDDEEGEGGEPALAGKDPLPGAPDTLDSNNEMVNPERPHYSGHLTPNISGDYSGNQPGNPTTPDFQQQHNRHRPETD